MNPEDLVLWSGQSFQMSATAFHVEGDEIECAEFEWNLEDYFVARLKGSEVEGKSAGQTHIWAILTSQNLKFFAGQGLVKVWEWREFSSPSGRKTNVIYNERKLPIYVEGLNKDGKVIFAGQYSYHPLLEEITESVLSFEGRGVKVVIRDYDSDCDLEDKTRPNEHPGDKVFCIEERKCDEDGNCSVYRKVIRNYEEGASLQDFACLWPPCNAHCMLNKDDGHFSRDDFSPCDGNIQKDAHWEVKSKATDSTKYHLDLFCKGLGGICY